jgi:hypothetical protein
MYAGDSSGASTGGAVTLLAGNAGPTGVGGPVNITAGVGGATSGTGGAVNLTAGASGGSGAGGAVVITAGDAAGTPADNGGDIELRPGALTGAGVDGVVRVIGPGSGTAGEMRLEDNAGGQYIGLQAAGIISSSFTLVLPAADATIANQVLVSDASGTLSFASGGAVAGSRFEQSFDDGDLTAGVLTVTHSLGTKYNHVTVYNNSDGVIIPTEITAVNTTGATVDLTGAQVAEGGAIPGTWNVVVSA